MRTAGHFAHGARTDLLCPQSSAVSQISDVFVTVAPLCRGWPSLHSWTGKREMPLIPGLVAGEAWHFGDLLLALGSVERLDSHVHKAPGPCLLWNLQTHDRAAKENRGRKAAPFTLRSSRSSRRGDARHGSEQRSSSNRAKGPRAEPTCQPPHWLDFALRRGPHTPHAGLRSPSTTPLLEGQPWACRDTTRCRICPVCKTGSSWGRTSSYLPSFRRGSF